MRLPSTGSFPPNGRVGPRASSGPARYVTAARLKLQPWGDFEAALAFSTQLQTVATAHDVPLHVGRLDTVARALMGLGHLEEAEAALLPGLHPETLQASLDGDAGADFLLTVAEVRRRRGHVAPTQTCLDECVRRCEEHGLTSIRVRARREQAEMHAAGGDFRVAFEEHKLYSQELIDLQSAQRDARARALQAMYETTEARRQSRRYRELSLRDPSPGSTTGATSTSSSRAC